MAAPGLHRWAGERVVVVEHASVAGGAKEGGDGTERAGLPAAPAVAAPHRVRANEDARRIDRQRADVRVERPELAVHVEVLLDVGDVEGAQAPVVRREVVPDRADGLGAAEVP